MEQLVKELSRLTEHVELHLKNVTSVIVIRDDKTVYEHYFHGTHEESLFPLRSMTKSVTTTLIGIAVDRGLIKGEDQQIDAFFDKAEQLESNDEVLKTKLRSLLTMTSGFQLFDKDLPLLMQQNSPNWIASILRCEVNQPGTFIYKGCEMHLLSAIITRCAKMNAAEFAEQFLFQPLGINNYQWGADPQGNALGSTGLALTARDISKLGSLYLKQGTWNERRVVPSQWVVKATSKQSEGLAQYGSYGYGWWITSFNNFSAYMAAGSKGQYIINIPSLDLTVTITCDAGKEFVDPRSIVNSFIIPVFSS